MKTIFSAIVIILCGYFITGCKKDSSIVQAHGISNNTGSSSNSQVPDSGIYYVTISGNSMIQNTNVYLYNIQTLVAPANISSPVINVFLLINNYEVPINHPISFMNGTIWTNIDGMNVKVLYRSESDINYLPFGYLNLKIEIQ